MTLITGPSNDHSHSLSKQSSNVILPGEYIELKSKKVQENTPVAIEPRGDLIHNWIEPTVSQCVGGVICIPNLTPNPVLVRKHKHVAQIHYTSLGEEENNSCQQPKPTNSHRKLQETPYSDGIHVDPQNQLPVHGK